MLAVVHGVNTSAQQNPTWGTAPTGYTAFSSDNTTANGAGSNDSLYLAQQVQATPGTTGAVVVTVTNAQTSLDGFLVAIKTSVASTTPHVTVYDGSTELPVAVSLWSGTAEQQLSSVRIHPGPQTLTSLMAQTPYYIAHRGSSANWPEETIYAYVNCANLMVRALEISVWMSSDGVFVCSHDQSLLRTTGYDIDIPTNPWSVLSTYTVLPVGTDNQAQPGRPLCRLAGRDGPVRLRPCAVHRGQVPHQHDRPAQHHGFLPPAHDAVHVEGGWHLRPDGPWASQGSGLPDLGVLLPA